MLTETPETGMRIQIPRSFVSHLVFLTAISCAVTFAQEAPAGADAAGLAVLDAARHAYNEGKFDAATERFREFLKQNGQKKEASAAQYGLALSLLELPQKDYTAIVAALQAALVQQDSSDHPFVLYHLGAAQRNLGIQALDLAASKLAESEKLRKLAVNQFAEASKNFAAAANAFAKSNPAAGHEWELRSLCDQCDVLLRLEKNQEVAELARKTLALLASADYKELAKSPFRELSFYQLGAATFALKDYLSAARALSQLAPFDQMFAPLYYGHARYLLSRTHQLAGENPEAGAGYKALLADFEIQKKMATEAMKNAAALSADERTRYETLLKPPPDYIARATFYSALIQSEAGEFGEAMGGFGAFVQQFPGSPLIDEAKLRLGFCLLQVKNYAEAAKVLQPLQTHAQLGDRALWWSARAMAEGVDPLKPETAPAALKGAIELLGKAAEKAGALGQSDPDAKERRGDILLELGDTQQTSKLYKEALATYEKVGAEFGASDRAEVALQRQATALHLAGQYKESDELCQKFERTYPNSILLDDIGFRGAENACLSAMAASKDPKANENRAAWEKQFDEAIERYEKLLAKYPEYANINLARYGLGSAQYQRGKYAEAFDTLSNVLDADRIGELAAVNYLLGDCLVRQLPVETDDALQTALLIDRAEDAARLLKKYADAQGKTPQAADALLKLAHCNLRRGALIIDPLERTKILADARQTYDKILNEMGNTPAMPSAVLERAHCIALQGDIGGAMNEYNRFNGDPLKKSALAPLAMIRFATLLKTQNRFPDAVNVMTECWKRYEALKADPAQSGLVSEIQYEYALALKEAGKIGEARVVFVTVHKDMLNSPDGARANWRSVQCMREQMQESLSSALAIQKKPDAKPEELAAAAKTMEDTVGLLRQMAEGTKLNAARLNTGETRLWMIYEAAWCYRVVSDHEIDSARRKIAGPALAKVLENLKKAAPPNSPIPALALPEIPLSDIPPQPSEKLAQEQYEAIIALAPASAMAARARLELAEMLSLRGQNDAALELLAGALEENPPLDLAERLHLRLAACLIAKDQGKLALVQAQAVTRNAASGMMGEAVYMTGESYIQLKDWNNAIGQLSAFRDKDPFKNMNILTERGLLRLGYALAQAQRWDESRQALETLVQRFPQSAFVYEARFGIATAWQNVGQWDNAYNAFAEVTKKSAGEFAARALLQMGKCRLAQKRFPDAQKDLMAVAATYDYREVSAEALCELGQCFVEQNQPAEATKVWQGVVKDFGESKFAEAAKKRLAGVK